MAIEKPLSPSPVPMMEEDDEDEGVEVEIGPDAVTTEDSEGGVVIMLNGMTDDEEEDDEEGHDDNLAEYLEDDDLKNLASDLVQEFEADYRSRKDWANAYVKGLDLLGMKVEERTQPWPGAAGMFHPLLTEAVVRFQAQAMAELFPAAGPARTKIVGKMTPEKMEQAKRVQMELNYLLTEEMTEYRDEMEHMLFRVPLAGSAFKKVYFDPLRKRPVAMFVPAEDFVVSYGASDLHTCGRYTHVMKKDANELRALMVNEFYRDVDLPDPAPDITDIQEKYDQLQGQEAVIEDDDRHTLLEMHVDLDLPEPYADPDGIARPYIVTIDKSSQIILSIRRNWYEDDEKCCKRMHFVHYRYLPGMGFYGIGLIHLIGGLAKSATSILRQLVDAGTLANLPAGLKARGMRIKGDNTPLMPGEFRDVDVPGGTIKDSITFLPYKEPSTVLYQLLGNVVDEGRRIGSIADVDVGDMSAQAPVGTTLALLERSLKVMSGVQARMHAALKQELRLISRVIYDYMDEKYAYDIEGEWDRHEDFDDENVSVIPVSDPNAATMAQRVVQYQAALQLAQSAPHLYDMGRLHRQMLEVLNIQDADEIIKLPEDLKPKDPIAENMAILKQEPVKSFLYQDHEAHIQVHMAAAQDPKIQQMVGQSPFAGAIQAAMASHITEHIAMQYRVDMQKKLGVELPDPEEPMPEDVEQEVSRLAAQAADKLLRQHQNEAAAAAAEAAAKDPLTIIQRKELEIKEREVVLKEKQAQHDALIGMEEFLQSIRDTAKELELQEKKLNVDAKQAAGQLAVDIATKLEAQRSSERQKGAELGVRMAEVLSAEKVARAKKPDGAA
jgi:hypothetical protein